MISDCVAVRDVSCSYTHNATIYNNISLHIQQYHQLWLLLTPGHKLNTKFLNTRIQCFEIQSRIKTQMAPTADVVGYFCCICMLFLLSMTRPNNGYQLAFFRYADMERPHFYLTVDEINNAMKSDEQ